MTVPLDELRTLLEAATVRDGDVREIVVNRALIVAALSQLDALIACAEALEKAGCQEEHYCPASPLFMGSDVEDADKFPLCWRCAALDSLPREPSA